MRLFTVMMQTNVEGITVLDTKFYIVNPPPPKFICNTDILVNRCFSQIDDFQAAVCAVCLQVQYII